MIFFSDKNSLGSQIRCRDVAEHLEGSQFNPVCVHFKPKSLEFVRDGDWVDISDGAHVPELLKKRPLVNAIACSLHSYNILKKELPNKLVWISQQHLNWENAKRERKEITTCGYIGALSPVSEKIYREVGEALEKNGWKFIFCHDYKTREDAVNFYKSIDVLVVGVYRGDGIYKTPTKLINAASFGVPSVADPLEGYEEWEGNYCRADSLEAMLAEVNKFKDAGYYQAWSDKIIKEAEKYHINEVIKKYTSL